MDTPEAKRFYAVDMFVVVPLVVYVFGNIARAALFSPGWPIGVVAAFITVSVTVNVFRTPYLATVGTDGTLTVKWPTRTLQTNVSLIRRIRPVRSGGRWPRIYFDFADGSEDISGMVGRSLARHIRKANPGVELTRLQSFRGSGAQQ